MDMAIGLIFFHYSTLLRPERCLLVYSGTYNAFFMDLLLCVIFTDNEKCRFGGCMLWFPFIFMKIVSIFHSGYFDCKGASRTVLLCNGLNIADNEV